MEAAAAAEQRKHLLSRSLLRSEDLNICSSADGVDLKGSSEKELFQKMAFVPYYYDFYIII